MWISSVEFYHQLFYFLLSYKHVASQQNTFVLLLTYSLYFIKRSTFLTSISLHSMTYFYFLLKQCRKATTPCQHVTGVGFWTCNMPMNCIGICVVRIYMHMFNGASRTVQYVFMQCAISWHALLHASLATVNRPRR